jgi:putative transposase
VEFNGEEDHVHLLINYPPHIQLSKLIANLKTVSSRLIRKEFRSEVNRYYRKSVFWTGAYFVASCGGVTVEELKRYVGEDFMLEFSQLDSFCFEEFLQAIRPEGVMPSADRADVSPRVTPDSG